MTTEQTQQQLSPSFIYPPSILAGISIVAYHFPQQIRKFYSGILSLLHFDSMIHTVASFTLRTSENITRCATLLFTRRYRNLLNHRRLQI